MYSPLLALLPRTFIEAKHGYREEVFSVKESRVFIGNWQSFRYLRHFENQLKGKVRKDSCLSAKAREMLKKTSRRNSVAVHVRRGDFVNHPRFGLLSPEYFRMVIAKVRKTITDATFLVFSDEPEYARFVIEPCSDAKVISTTHLDAVDEFVLMQSCRAFVTSNSTYSLWAAWLGDHPGKKVWVPEPFFANVNYCSFLVPPEWNRVPALWNV